MSLFHPRLIKKITEKPLEMPQAHSDILTQWANSIQDGTIYNVKETALRSDFIHRIFADVLGFKTVSSQGKSYSLSEEYQLGSGSVDVALGNFDKTDQSKNEVIAPFELKGAKTKDLDAIMSGRGKSPVAQAWEYGMDAKGAKWVLVTNYTEIRLYAIGYGRKNYELFDLKTLHDPIEYTKFIALLSHESLINGHTVDLLKQSEQQDKDITNALYDDYKTLRANLIKHIGKDNPDREPLEIIKLTQTLLDRILFVAFAEDKGLLSKNTLKSAFETKNPYSPQPVWENFRGLFHAIDKGNSELKIPAYNGGLFATNPALDSLSITDELCEGFKDIGDYDFDSDVSVNILGHIFEQSISDLEELKAHAGDVDTVLDDSKQSKRKKDGIFYTPAYITRYIVEQAVGGWLNDRKQELGFDKLPELTDKDFESIKMVNKGRGKNQTTSIQYNKNIAKHIEFWEAYKEALSNIKVLDPACGSGAFLNEVFDYLKAEGEQVNSQLAILKNEQTTLFRWDTHILANNIYGVDLNNESVEITKLSLWLKTANRNEKLTYLEDNIKVGNSLIDDPEIAGESAFDWNSEFADIMNNGGFDVIVGNPPYGAELSGADTNYIELTYQSFEYQVNTYVVFYEKGIMLLNKDGYLSYITPATFLYQHYFGKIRNILCANDIVSIAKYNYAVFDDADVGDTVSFTVKRNDKQRLFIKAQVCDNKSTAVQELNNIESEKIITKEKLFYLSSNGLNPVIFEKHPRLSDVAQIVVGVKPYQTGKGKPKQTKETVKNKPFTVYEDSGNPLFKQCVIGSNFHRYKWLEKPDMFLKYGEWLAEPRMDAPFFKDTKIIIRQTADCIIANIDNTQSVNLNNVYNVCAIDCSVSNYYLIGLLNSKLVNALYSEIAQEKGKLFAEVKKVYLSKLPIAIPSEQILDKVVCHVKELINKNSILQSLNLRMFSLLKSDLILNEKFKLPLNWTGYEYKDFVSIIEKNIKPQKLSLSQKSEWMEHFETEKAKAVAIKNEIDQLDKEIDQMVYELYDLRPDEITLIEEI